MEDTEEEKARIARDMIRRQSIEAVLQENGMTEEEFVRWLEEGEVADYLYRMAKSKAMAKASELWLKLEEMAFEGDVKAMKLYYDLCERKQYPESRTTEIQRNREVDAVRREIFGNE